MPLCPALRHITKLWHRIPLHNYTFRSLSRRMATESSYDQAVDKLYSLVSNADVMLAWQKERRDNPNVTLEPEMRFHCNLLEIDLRSLPVIHVAGTKGKGSTCAFCEEILIQHGVSTGTFTSPHLISPRERFRINGEPISKEKFTHYFWKTYNTINNGRTEEFPGIPPYFRFLTLMAFLTFQSEKLQACVIEVGIGGRTDSTNVVNPIVCAITSLGYDHMNVLGDSISSIAFEKAGIMKPGIPAFTIQQDHQEAMDVLQQRSEAVNSSLTVIRSFSEQDSSKDLKFGIRGKHQLNNAMLAVACTRVLFNNKQASNHPIISDGVLLPLSQTEKRALASASIAGRGTIMKYDAGSSIFHFYLDGAHTPESVCVAAEAFCEYLQEERDLKQKSNENYQTLGGSEFVLLFNTKGRDPQKLIPSVLSGAKDLQFNEIVMSTNSIAENPSEDEVAGEFASAKQNSECWKAFSPSTKTVFVERCIPDAISRILNRHKTDGKHVYVFVVGSFYLVGGTMQILSSVYNVVLPKGIPACK